ncbi:hypothetical protein DYB32_007123, partial [Aphanomyces invadans]
MKIRAFRKTVLLHVYPTLPDNPKQVLADLFPDIVADTIDQMFEACANDLNSCFEVLSGLSDYSTLESSLSPKAPYLRRIASTKQSIAGQNDLNDDDLNAPIFDVKGYKKPRKPDKALVSVVSDGGATSLDGKYLSIPQTLDEESFVDAWPQMPPTLAIDAFSQFESAQQVVIVGGGPVGLRTAIEVALLGGEAIVVEKRSNFNREQILHLFPWVVHDLTKLGAKMFYPQSAVDEFSWAKQYNQSLFAQLKDDLGVDVENVVYYREEVHYVVMTPKRSSLVNAGILATKELDSVDVGRLHDYVRKVLAFF